MDTAHTANNWIVSPKTDSAWEPNPPALLSFGRGGLLFLNTNFEPWPPGRPTGRHPTPNHAFGVVQRSLSIFQLFLLHKNKLVRHIGIDIRHQRLAVHDLASQQFFRQAVDHQSLHGPFERTRAVGGIVSGFGQ